MAVDFKTRRRTACQTRGADFHGPKNPSRALGCRLLRDELMRARLKHTSEEPAGGSVSLSIKDKP